MDQSIKKKFVAVLFGILIVIGGLAGVILYKFLPEYYIAWYPVFPLLYFALGVLLVYAIGQNQNVSPQRLAAIYMMQRGIKMAATVALIVVYLLLVKVNVNLFLITLVAYYFIYLAIEAWIVYKNEKNIKERQISNESR